ncbi:hypothetical protein ACFX2I_035115 [Malus domestica]
MHGEIDSLHQLLLHSRPLETLRPCLLWLMLILAKLNLPDKAVAHFKSLRSRFPDEPPSVFLYNLLLESSLTENHVEFVLWLLLDDAREVFDKMRGKGCLPNEYSVGILVRGYYRAGLAGRGLEVLDEVRSYDVFPNKVVYNTLISSFCKQGRTDEAEKLVERMREDGLFLDAVTSNSRISALCSAGKILEASRIFRDMYIDDQELGLPQPNVITYNLMLQGFCKGC